MAAIEPRVDKTVDTLKSPHAVSGQKKLDSVRQPDLTPIKKRCSSPTKNWQICSILGCVRQRLNDH